MQSSALISWKVAGMAGEGIDVTGVMFGKLCMRHGLNVFSYREYPSLIRGGHNTHQVHASFEPFTSHQKQIDVLIALTEEGISRHLDEMDATTVVICEATQGKYDLAKYAGQTAAKLVDVPMANMSREETGHFLAQNVVALGISVWLLGLDIEILKQVLKDQFGGKGEEVVAANERAALRGYEFAKAQLQQIKPMCAPRPQNSVLLTGNHAVALGALAAGLQYFSAYPMTPTSDILHTLAAQQHNFPLVVKHAEDEISAINQVIGASYAGVRAMTASATGGYALMVEATSLAAIMETPLVICVGQRPGPATGLPTWTCQSDLQMIISAGHGECPKIVLTPGTVQEHFELTRLAFALAEKYHLLVYILSDKFALESYATMPAPDGEFANERFSFAGDAFAAGAVVPEGAQFPSLPADNSYRRYAVTDSGYSPRSIPGQEHGLSITNSYEHDEFGYGTEEGEMATVMNDKRHRKLVAVMPELPPAQLLGPATAPTTLVGWGSTRLVGEMVVARAEGKVNFIHIPCAWPFPVESFTKLAQAAQNLVMIEGNVNGQMEKVVRQETGIQFAKHIRRYDGRPFDVEEVLTELSLRT